MREEIERENDTSQPCLTLSQVHSSWTVKGEMVAHRHRERETEERSFVCSRGEGRLSEVMCIKEIWVVKERVRGERRRRGGVLSWLKLFL